MATKICRRCKESKARSEFNSDCTRKDGLHNNCKSCRHAAAVIRYAANADQRKADARGWYSQNRDRQRANAANWRAENPNQVRAANRAWREANPERYRALASLAGARRRAIVALATEPLDPIEILERDRWHCHLCGISTPRRLRGSHDPRAPELDHIIPLSRGGEHSAKNTACSCRKCNRVKSAMPLGQLRMFG